MTGRRADPYYSIPQRKQFRSLVTYYLKEDQQWKTQDGKVILPQVQARNQLAQMHQWTHVGAKKLV